MPSSDDLSEICLASWLHTADLECRLRSGGMNFSGRGKLSAWGPKLIEVSDSFVVPLWKLTIDLADSATATAESDPSRVRVRIVSDSLVCELTGPVPSNELGMP